MAEFPSKQPPRKIESYSRSSAGSDVFLVNSQEGRTQHVRAITSVGVEPSDAPYRPVVSYDSRETVTRNVRPDNLYREYLTGDRVGDHIVCSSQVGWYNQDSVRKELMYGVTVSMATGIGEAKVVARRLFTGHLPWMRGALAFGYVAERERGAPRMLLFDLGGRGSIEPVSSVAVGSGRMSDFVDAVLMSSQGAVVSCVSGLHHVDMRGPTSSLIGCEEALLKSPVLAGCRLFFTETQRTSSAKLQVRSLKCGGPPGGIWSVGAKSNVCDLFSWSPSQGPLGVIMRDYNIGVQSTSVVLMDPRRQHCVELDSSSRFQAGDSHHETPSTICGIPVLLQVDLHSSKVKVVI